jgi:hypothetical protein
MAVSIDPKLLSKKKIRIKAVSKALKPKKIRIMAAWIALTNCQYHNKSYRHNLRGHHHDIKSLH